MRWAVGILLVTMASSCVVSGGVATTKPPAEASDPIPAAPFSTVGDDLDDLEGLEYEKVADVVFPVQVVARPGDDVAYVLTKGGLILTLADDQLGDIPVLDLSRSVGQAREQGLLSMLLTDDTEIAFISYTATNGDTVLSEFRFSEDGSRLDRDSERVLLRLGQPAKNHNGGMLQMSGGRIFLSLGDGGGAGDTFGNAQNTDTFYGGIITLSPTGDPDPVLFAYGLRNPWRFWIDSDLLYIADVGQDSYEEINVVRLEPGQNFGWPIAEGRHCYRPAEHCDPTGMVFPVLELEHGDDGACSITGGVVYRGSAIPELDGFYLYSDFCGGFLRGIRYLGDGEIDSEDWTDSAGVVGQVSGFGLDGDGEVYVATVDAIHRIVADR
jgi:hypothetical protein